MTKEQLQKELKEKVKEGVKPSQLKRSKSLSDIGKIIPKAPPLPPNLTKSKSSESFSDPRYPFTTLISQNEKIDELIKESQAKSDTIKLLRGKIEKLENELKANPPTPLLQEQLRQKQSQVELLREQLEEISQKLTQTTQELDNSLIARHESNQKFNKVYDNWKAVKLELIQTEDDYSNDLILLDQQNSQLHTTNLKLKQSNSQLKRDLDIARRDLSLVERLAEMRKVPLISKKPAKNETPWFDYPSLWWVLSFCLTTWWWLSLTYKKQNIKKYDL